MEEAPREVKGVAELNIACSSLARGPHSTRHFLLAGPLFLDPAHIQRLSANLAFVCATDYAGEPCELIAKCRDGFLAPLDIDMLCSACSVLEDVVVFPEVDTDSGTSMYFHIVSARCRTSGKQLPDPAHRIVHLQLQEEKKANSAKANSARKSGTGTAARWGVGRVHEFMKLVSG